MTPRTLGTRGDAVKTGSGEARHDLTPLTSRFSALGGATAATWYSGELGGSAPGPTTYWIDAVVTVPDDVAARLLATDPQTAPGAPEVIGALAPELPAGLRTGPALDALFAQGDFRTTAWVTPDARTVVLASVGG